jgi:hypothetical protein
MKVQPTTKELIAMLYERLPELFYRAAPVQEPVAQPASKEDMKVYRAIADNYRKDLAAAQPAPAPGYCKHCKQYSIEEPLPAAQRQWAGLTDEERKEIWKGCDPTHAGYVTALVEAKLKEKNNG